MFDEMKNPLGGKSRSVSIQRDGTRALIQAVYDSSVLVSYIFLEIQVTEKWSFRLDYYRWRLSQEIPELRIEQKMSDARPSVLIISCVCAVQCTMYNACIVAIVTSCRIMLNGVQSWFIDLKKYAGVVTEISWWRLSKIFSHFLPVFSFILQNRCFNSVSYSNLVSEMHDVCHCQALPKKFFPSKDNTQPDHFVPHKEELASYPVLLLLFHLSFSAGL